MKRNTIFLTLLLTISVITTTMADGHGGMNTRDKAQGRSMRKNYRAHRHMMSEMYENLTHGELSDQEKQDMQAIHNKDMMLESMHNALRNKHIEQIQAEDPEHAEMMDDHHDDEMTSTRNSYSLLDQLAKKYSLTLEQPEIDTSSYMSSTIDALLSTSQNELLAYIDLLEQAHNNADDEDIQVTYLFLQKHALSKLSKTGYMMMQQGITPPQALIDAVNINNKKYLSQDRNNYPQAVLDTMGSRLAYMHNGHGKSRHGRSRRRR